MEPQPTNNFLNQQFFPIVGGATWNLKTNENHLGICTKICLQPLWQMSRRLEVCSFIMTLSLHHKACKREKGNQKQETKKKITHYVPILTRGSKSISLCSRRCIRESNAASTTWKYNTKVSEKAHMSKIILQTSKYHTNHLRSAYIRNGPE